MTDLGLDASQETRITVMQLKIERLEEKQDELRERLKVVEKWGHWSSGSIGSWRDPYRIFN